MIIAISGLHGTGKSTIAKKLADSLGLRYYSTGNAFRELADEMDMTLEEFSKHVEEHPRIDEKLDDRLMKEAKRGDVVVESQLSGYLLDDLADYKILLTCPLETRVKRMADRDGTDYEEKLKETRLRERSELERFKKLYDIDLGDQREKKKVFDLILSTEDLSVEEVHEKILSFIKRQN